MDSSFDVVIVGAGLAGSCAACVLSKSRSVLVLEAGESAAGASWAAAGMVNPLMARKARPIWRSRDALDAFEWVLSETGSTSLFDNRGVLRPALDEKQADHFRTSAIQNPDLAEWLDPSDVIGRWPPVEAPLGALHVVRGGAVPMSAFVRACLETATTRGAHFEMNSRVRRIEERSDLVYIETDRERWIGSRAILCLGADQNGIAGVPETPLHGIKGQTVVLERPSDLSEVPCMSSGAHIVPRSSELTVGSSYEHKFADLQPNPDQTVRILAKARRILPKIGGARVITEKAGVRATVPVTRLPIVGPPGDLNRTWTFNGLGAKGLLLGSLLARELPSFLDEPSLIPSEIRAPAQ